MIFTCRHWGGIIVAVIIVIVFLGWLLSKLLLIYSELFFLYSFKILKKKKPFIKRSLLFELSNKKFNLCTTLYQSVYFSQRHLWPCAKCYSRSNHIFFYTSLIFAFLSASIWLCLHPSSSVTATISPFLFPLNLSFHFPPRTPPLGMGHSLHQSCTPPG